jgi:hypothetical protein
VTDSSTKSVNTAPVAGIPSSVDVSTTPTETIEFSPASSARHASDWETETDEWGVTHGLSSWATGRYIRLCVGTGTRPDPVEKPITCITCARKWKSMREYFERVERRARENRSRPRRRRAP